MLIAGTFFLFLNPSSGGTATKAVRQGEAVRGGTAPAVIESATATPVKTPAPTGTAAPQRTYPAAPAFTIDPSAQYSATVKTDKGNVVISLNPKAAPQTVNNFVFLAEHHFYDGLSFQRVVNSTIRIAQAGAPNPDGSGGPGYTIPDENSPLNHDGGAVAMAETATQPNSAGSQFYVALVALPQQDGKDTVFGQVTAGLDILQSLPARDPRDPNAPPPLKIETITIEKQ